MKIIITDFWPKEAHKYLNLMMINAFSKCSQVTVVSVNGYYDDNFDDFNSRGISNIPISLKEKKGRLKTRFFCIDLQNAVKNLLKDNQYDLMVCLSYETVSLSFGGKLLNQIPVVLCQHSNLDDLSNPIKKLIIKWTISKTYHIVFEELFKNWMCKRLNLSQNQIFVIAHPITMESTSTEATNDALYDCVGLCHANDDVFIQSIIDKHIQFEENNIHIVLRSKNVKSDSDNIVIINKFLSRDKYQEYILKAKCVFVATPLNYQYRVSGSIYDAFSMNKPVFTTNDVLTQIYKDKYPGICHLVNDEVELFEALLKLRENSDNKKAFKRFRDDHSEIKLDSQIYNMIQKININRG